MPLVISLIKGDTSAAKMLMGGDDDDDDDDDDCADPAFVQGSKNVYEVSPYTVLSKIPSDSIAYIDIDGPMFKQGDWCSFGMEDYAELMYGLMNTANVAGVIIDADTPGGQVAGTASFADSIAACAKVKPVIGFVDDGICASAGYWFISACTEIYLCQSTAQVGSVGVYCTVADWYAYYASQGLPVKDVYAPGSEDKNLDYRESVAGNDDLLKAELEVLRNAFVSAVKINRKGKMVGTDWATGKMYFPAEAQSLGLIDGVKSFDQVVWRINRLISSTNKNQNTMAFERVLTVASADAFEVVDNGFVVTEDGLHAINTALTLADNNATELASAQATIARLTAEAQTVETAVATAVANATQTANATIAANTEKIAELEAKIVEMGKLDGNRQTAAESDKDSDAKPAVEAMDMAFQKQLLEKV